MYIYFILISQKSTTVVRNNEQFKITQILIHLTKCLSFFLHFFALLSDKKYPQNNFPENSEKSMMSKSVNSD